MRYFRGRIFQIVFIVIVGLLVYSNSFDVPFQFDDFYNITENPKIKDISNIPSIITGGEGRWSSRPVLQVSLALNYYFGQFDTWGYHAVNLAVHLINGILLYVLIVMTGRHLGYEEAKVGIIAFISSVLFVVHPVQTEAVTYIVSRSMLFAATFYLLGLILFLKTVTAKSRRAVYIAGLFLVSVLGMGSRENFATFPIMLIVYDMLFISDLKARRAARHFKAYLPVIASLAYLAFLVHNNTYVKLDEPMAHGIPPLQYAMTEFRVHWTYLRLLLFPLVLSIDHDYPTSLTLAEFPTLMSMAGYAGLWAFALLFAKRNRLMSFAVLWFLVLLIPISFGVAIMGGLRLEDVIFEHRLYLPSIALFTAIAAGLYHAFDRLNGTGRQVALAVMIAALFLTLSSATYARNKVWLSEISLWEDAVSKSPRKARTHYELGVAYSLSGHMDKAIEELNSTIRYNPGFTYAHIELGIAYASRGRYKESAEYFRKALELNPELGYVHGNLGVVYRNEGQLDKAVFHSKEAVRLSPDSADSHYNLGVAYYMNGSVDDARTELKTTLKLDPGKTEASRLLQSLEAGRR